MNRLFSLFLSVVVICGTGARSTALAQDLAATSQKVDQLLKAGNFVVAEPYARTMLALVTKAEGRNSDAAANASHTLAYVLMNENKNADAEPFARQALETWQKVKGPGSGAAGNAANTLATILMNLSRDGEAEPYIRLFIVSMEKEKGPESGAVANALNTQLRLLRTQGRNGEALPIAQRVRLIWEKEQGKGSGASANISNTIAIILNDLGRPGEAEAYARHAIEVWERVDQRAVPNGRNTLADTLNRLGKNAEALEQSRLVIEGWAKNDGPNSGSVALGSNNLAFKYLGLGQLDQAEAQFQRAYDIWSAMDGSQPGRGTALVLGGLADVAFVLEDWQKSFDLRSRAVGIWIDRTLRATTGLRLGAGEKVPSEIAQSAGHLGKLIKTAGQLQKMDPERHMILAPATFKFAQWRLSSRAADALAGMAARNAGNDPMLAELVRERQDRVAEWQKADKEVANARGAKGRDQSAIDALEKRLEAIDARKAAIDDILKSRFSNYAELAIPQPLSVEQVQTELHADEALIVTLDTAQDKPVPEETFLWVVTKTDVRWVRSELGTEALTREVAALRCGLDYTGAWRSKGSRCAELTGVAYTAADDRDGKPLPFDLARAHALYRGLFATVEDLIAGKHLLIVPSGPLTQLPFQVLVTAAPDPDAVDAMRRARWLIRDHAIFVLPAVSSLKALRRDAKPSRAIHAMIGFGNPLLDGGPDDGERASRARANTTCPVAVASIAGKSRGVTQLTAQGPKDVAAQISRAPPLPETADELCLVAQAQKAGPGDIYLGARATVPEVERLSAAGALATYHLVHFATHGALSGDISASAEPGLLLTPPKFPTDNDDGYLTATRIAGLKLDADWVILSACNTAAGGVNGAEALSGLARAFFYAGARALLVSHWSVNSDATVKLITGAISQMSEGTTKIGRAEALRSSMLAMIDGDAPFEAHPSYWAPFVIVGEGATSN